MIPKETSLLTPALLAVLVLAGATWSASTRPSPPTSARPVVVAGVTEWGALARQLVGSDARVVSLLRDPNADPHEHEATVADARHVAGALVVIENGAGYDTWLSQLVTASNSRAMTLNVASLVHVRAGANPHLFYSPRFASRLVAALARRLEGRRGFANVRARAARLQGQLADLESRLTAIRQRCGGVRVAATEDVVTYLLDEAGLRVVTPERLRLAIGNGVDPNVRDLVRTLDQLRTRPALLVDNTQTATPLTQEIVARARASGVPVLRVTETMTGPNYVGFLSRTISHLQRDLRLQGCLA